MPQTASIEELEHEVDNLISQKELEQEDMARGLTVRKGKCCTAYVVSPPPKPMFLDRPTETWEFVNEYLELQMKRKVKCVGILTGNLIVVSGKLIRLIRLQCFSKSEGFKIFFFISYQLFSVFRIGIRVLM